MNFFFFNGVFLGVFVSRVLIGDMFFFLVYMEKKIDFYDFFF